MRTEMLDPAQALPHLRAKTQPNQSCPARGARRPTFTGNRAWSRSARTRGTNRIAAPNGRDCLTSVTSQNWQGARPLPPPRPSGPPGPAHSSLRNQSEGGRHTSDGGGGAGWRPGEARARSGLAWAELPRARVLRGAEGRTRTEGCGRHPGQTAAGALLCPVRILVHRCRVVRGRQGGEVEGVRGERPRVEGPGARRASVATSYHGSRAAPGCQRAGRPPWPRECPPRLPADTLGPAWPSRLSAAGCAGRSAEAGAAWGPGGPEDAECLWARRAGCMERQRCACPGSGSPPPRAVMPPRRQGGFVCFFFFSPPLFPPSILSSPPSPFTGLLRDLAPPPLPPPRRRLL